MSGREKLLDRRRKIRGAIQDAAIREFAENGLVGASTQAIAMRAGLSKPQLHYYISSKDDLYEEVLLFIMDEWSRLFALSSMSGHPRAVIREYVSRKIAYSCAHPDTVRVFSNEVARGAPVLRKYWSRSRESALKAAAIIQQWIDDGLIRKVDPMLFQFHLWATTQHYADYEAQVRFMLDMDEGADIDQERIVDEVTAMFLHHCGLAPEMPEERDRANSPLPVEHPAGGIDRNARI